MATLSLREFVDVVGFADPASGKTSTPGCENAIVVVGQTDWGAAFVLDAYGRRTDSTVLNQEIFMRNRTWGVKRFGIEASAQQYLYYESLVREAGARRERIILIPIEQPTNQTKEWRITTTIQEWMNNGMLYVDRNLVALKRQLEVYPTGQLVDIVDALASALRMLHSPFAVRTSIAYDDLGEAEARARRDRRYAPFTR